MNEGMIIELGQQTMLTILLMSAPMLGFGLIVGLSVSIFQTITSIQEQTLTFVPKIIAVFTSIIVFSPWLLSIIINFTNTLFEDLSRFIQ
ncbi:flagellar biosynthesis protein FliQ [Tindallia californiensis]|uniref:Flagellar biosynthetic protein FliQ n=1 Tax=Tindallia californiensis TaxID=159292 RepID=A0A1H3NT63_9FIRM|nr:flagellar biosynthesis protein FliQ [Tindallia californiensis]SDY91359.1 flagellar biosynthetic protein FliQ [Tindallia californiensis]